MNGGGSLQELQGPVSESNALLECTRAILSGESLEGAARIAFDHCRRLTGARAGYVAILREEENLNEVLLLDAGGFTCTVDPSLPMPVRGLRAEACRRGETIVANSFAESDWAGLLPEGHVRIENALFSPLVIEGRAVGLIGLANKDGGFSENDGRIAARFADMAALALRHSLMADRLEDEEQDFRSLCDELEDRIEERTIALTEANLLLETEVKERARAEEELGRKSALLEAIGRAQSLYITETEPDKVFEKMLQDLLSLTGSEYGFIGEVFREDDVPHLKTRALTNIAWSEETKRFYEENAPRGLKFTNLDTLFGEVLRTGCRLVANDPSRHPRRGGLPEGHPPLTSLLGLPIFSGSDMVGMAGIANRPGGYDDGLADFLEPLLRACGAIILALRVERLRQAAENGLKEQREFLRGVMEALPHPLYVINAADYTIMMANEAAGGAAAVEGRPCYAVTHGRETPCDGDHLCPMTEVRRTGKPALVEHVHRDEEGRLKPYAVQGYPLFDAAGAVTMIIEYNIDLSDRRQREKELARSRAEFEAIFNAISDAVVFVDTERRVVLVNPAFSRLFGYTLDEIRGSRTRFLYADPADFDEQGRQRYSPGADPDAPVYEMSYRRKDGSLFVSETLGARVKAPDGSAMGFIGVIRDISERKKLEEQLSHSQRLETIGEMAGGVAHDFNNILAGILGNASLMKEELDGNSHLFESLETIEKSAQRGADLAARLLAFARKAPARVIAVDVNGLIEETLKIIPQTFDRSITITKALDVELPAVEGDPSYLGQVIMNLCLNARDAMPDGGALILTTRTVGRDEVSPPEFAQEWNGPWVVVSVIDNGTGMDGRTRQRIFDPFFTTKEPGKGTGLGLSVAYGVVKNLGGFMEVESAPGQGSVFRIILPGKGKVRAQGSPEGSLPKGSGETVLVVDDEEVVRRMAGRVLERFGYRVLYAPDGREAVERYRESCGGIDLVLLDVVMPRMGGRETLTELRRIDPAVKVIFSSGYTREEKLSDLAMNGVRGFIQKPYQVGQLLRTVAESLSKVP